MQDKQPNSNSHVKNSRLKIERKFTKENVDIYEGIDFIEWDSKIMEQSGKNLDARKVVAPSNWSQTSVDILAQKYLRRMGVPKFLKKVPEADMPEWLFRSEADESALDGMEDKHGGENDARMVIHRIVGTWTYWGWKGKYFASESDARAFYDEICYILMTQRAAPNSPQFFNTGIHWAYGTRGASQGHYYFDEELQAVTISKSAYERPQIHACFIQSIQDNLVEDGGILDLVMRESRIFKYGSGSGINFSTLRAKGESLSGGGKSSGLMSFLKIGDVAAGAIKSGGTTRRAAKMITLNADHPEIFDYINWKVKEDNKVISMIAGSRIVEKFLNRILKVYDETKNPDIKTNRRLFEAVQEAYENEIPPAYLHRVLSMLKQGVTDFSWEVFNSDFNGEAYASVSGQNSNNSVRLDNELLYAVQSDGNYKLTNRNDGKEFATIKAKYLWDKICLAAWICADPGVQYDTTINEWHTCPNSGRINGSNPCSEYMFLDNTACNLASINLVKFELDPKADEYSKAFDIEKFAHATRLFTIVLEISVHMAQFPSKQIAELSYEFRTLGLGYANLGGLLMRAGIPYDSEKGRAYAAYVTAVMHGVSYETSAEMAEHFGPFQGFELNRAPMLNVIKNHRRAVLQEECVGVDIQPIPFNQSYASRSDLKYITNLWDRVVEKGEQYGYRNAQTTLLAPTGTIGLLMSCTTTGVEPDYAIVKYKKLAGGGYMKIVNDAVEFGLTTLGYNQNQIADIVRYIIGTGNINTCKHVNPKNLIALGFKEEEICKINDSLPSAFNIDAVFSPWTLGEELFKRLNVPEGASMLEFLGFTKEQITEDSLISCGYMCIEGAPYLKEEHLEIFDCANRNGAHGKRYISVDGHVLMMAAVQPFLSGAISKTVNMPEEATIEDCGRVYMFGWECGLKAMALYRDNSKLSSAMMSGSSEESIFAKRTSKTEPQKRGAKEVLPSRRKGYTQRVTIGGESNVFYHTTGENEIGDIREIFVTGNDSDGASFKSLMNCFAKAISIGLQHGVPVETMVSQFLNTNFPPNGIVTGHPSIRFASSAVDYMMRDIGINYRKMKYLGQIKTNDTKVSVQSNDATKSTDEAKYKELGYTGGQCTKCHGFRMRQDGACSYCEECGSNTGCG